jgi:hypothetical protein
VREELRVAVNRAAVDGEFRVFLVLLPDAPTQFDWTALDPFLSSRTWVDLRWENDSHAVLLLARAVRGEPLGWIDRNAGVPSGTTPYVGLRTFTSAEAQFFFGRDNDIQRLVEKLRHEPFLAALGRSGSGKSSVVRAGLLPALASGRAIEGSDRWRVQTLTPTATPLEEMAAHLHVLRPEVSAPQILDDLRSSSLTNAQAADLSRRSTGASPVDS